MTATVEETATLRGLMTVWLEKKAASGKVRTSELVNDAWDELATDPEFVDAWMREGLATIVASYAQDFFHARRRAERRTIDDGEIPVGQRVFENINGTYTALGRLTRPSVHLAIDDRRKQIAGHQRVLGFYEEVVQLFPDDTTELGALLAPEELASIWERHTT